MSASPAILLQFSAELHGGIAIWIYQRHDLKGLVGRVLQRQPTASFNNRLLHLLRVNLVPSLIGHSDLETHRRYGLKGLTI